MSDKKFEKGERCAVYGSVKDNHRNILYLRGARCEVVEVIASDELLVKADVDGWKYSVHPKQCRRLKRRERRRVWINFHEDGRHHVHMSKESAMAGSECQPGKLGIGVLDAAVCFIECVKRKGK